MVDTTPDYYAILGVPKTATQEEIRSKYFDLAKKYHADLYQTPATKELAEKEMKKIISAYDIIGDPEKRKEYDAKFSRGTSIVSAGSKALSAMDKFLNNERVADRVGKITNNIGWSMGRMINDMDETFNRPSTNKKETKDKSPKADKKQESAISILKKRYAKGEITKSQYLQMKKELE